MEDLIRPILPVFPFKLVAKILHDMSGYELLSKIDQPITMRSKSRGISRPLFDARELSKEREAFVSST